MSKKFKGKACVYCLGTLSSTADHVFAKEFFIERDRKGLPKAPACESCNRAKSQLEHYLTTVLPFGGRHLQALENLQGGVPPRLAKNQRLNREMLHFTQPGWIRGESGVYQQTSVFPMDGDKLTTLLKYVGRGLAWHHWRVYLRPDDEAIAMFLPDMGTAIFQSLINDMRPSKRVVENLGKGTIEYVGIQAADPPQLTVWTISMYGGLVLSDGRTRVNGEALSCTTWWVITGPRELAKIFGRLERHEGVS